MDAGSPTWFPSIPGSSRSSSWPPSTRKAPSTTRSLGWPFLPTAKGWPTPPGREIGGRLWWMAGKAPGTKVSWARPRWSVRMVVTSPTVAEKEGVSSWSSIRSGGVTTMTWVARSSLDPTARAWSIHRAWEGGGLWWSMKRISDSTSAWMTTASCSPRTASTWLKAGDANSWFIVVDGKRGRAYAGVGRPVFTPDGRQVAHSACDRCGGGPREDAAKFVVVDGRRIGAEYSDIAAPIVFSADGRRMAFAARRESAQFVVVDEKEEKAYAGVMAESLMFSPTGRDLVYAAARDTRRRMM